MDNIPGSLSFSPRILDHLGISAYNSVRKCLAELVANAYDADAREVRIDLPDIIDDNAIITITDDGSGMTAKDVKSSYTSEETAERKERRQPRVDSSLEARE